LQREAGEGRKEGKEDAEGRAKSKVESKDLGVIPQKRLELIL
jgi:hypothetical protein